MAHLFIENSHRMLDWWQINIYFSSPLLNQVCFSCVCRSERSFRDPFHHDLMGKKTAGWVKPQKALLLFGCPLPRGKDGDKQRWGEADMLRGLNRNGNSLGFGEIKLSNEEAAWEWSIKDDPGVAVSQHADDSFLLTDWMLTFLLSVWLTTHYSNTDVSHSRPTCEGECYSMWYSHQDTTKPIMHHNSCNTIRICQHALRFQHIKGVWLILGAGGVAFLLKIRTCPRYFFQRVLKSYDTFAVVLHTLTKPGCSWEIQEQRGNWSYSLSCQSQIRYKRGSGCLTPIWCNHKKDSTHTLRSCVPDDGETLWTCAAAWAHRLQNGHHSHGYTVWKLLRQE